MKMTSKLMRALILPGAVTALFLLAGCHSTPVSDTEKPVVKFIQPLDGDSFSAGVYVMKAFATDNVRVTEVVFWTEGEMLGLIQHVDSDTYQLGVDTRSDTGHVYKLYVEADDEARNMGWDSVTVHIRR
jgi:vacuolar-type H+-ATPase subunit F/Vma7